ncbi:hypothetical protein F53441_4146 [Fusarium austroafricanum]|uniref:Protein kinase domain-containing protein n=1 Tax=Fusarium austroafricanum TaxID=2364996 RepID=A0A8H4NVV8_9HYPO|nr:hypothetical protein F53441_4146 [Fusarium austroafricanum]
MSLPDLGLLPACPGPQLAPYGGDLMSSKVEFLKLLQVDSAHGVIVQAKINRRLYAIKYFVDDGLPKNKIYYNQVYGDKKELWNCCEAFDWYFSPFENECRAFGRLKEKNVEHLAVKVHGWVRHTVEQIDMKLTESVWGRYRDVQALFAPEMSPDKYLFGIVKDWVEMSPYYDQALRSQHDQMAMVTHFPQMLQNLHMLHFNGIVVRDLKFDQYINGTFVDFSLACTVPHPFGPMLATEKNNWQPRWTYESMAAWDLFCFQSYIIDEWKEESAKFFAHRPRNGVPIECKLDVYPWEAAQDEIRSGLFKPMLNHYHELAMVKKPAFDPLMFLVRNKKYASVTAMFPKSRSDVEDFVSRELGRTVQIESFLEDVEMTGTVNVEARLEPIGYAEKLVKDSGKRRIKIVKKPAEDRGKKPIKIILRRKNHSGKAKSVRHYEQKTANDCDKKRPKIVLRRKNRSIKSDYGKRTPTGDTIVACTGLFCNLCLQNETGIGV